MPRYTRTVEEINSRKVFFWHLRGPYACLSNFFMVDIEVDGKIWPSVEHYYQAQKSNSEFEREVIRIMPTAPEVKAYSKKLPLPPNWDEIKEQVMYRALRAKFTQSRKCKKVLVSTRGKQLFEDSPFDKYWGRRGLNRLGLLLERVRDELFHQHK